MHRRHINILQAMQINALSRLDMGQRSDAVAIGSGGLEFEGVARRGHAIGQPRLDVLAAPGKKFARFIDQGGIGGFADAPNTGRRTALDLVLQAGARTAGEYRIGTGAQWKGAVQGIDRLIYRAGRGEGAKIFSLRFFCASVFGDARIGVAAGDQAIGKGFVVSEDAVVVRLEAFDEVAFKQQRLDLTFGRHYLDTDGAGNHAL